MGYCQNARSLASCGLNWQFLRSLGDMNKMKYITAVLILIQRNNQQSLEQAPACDISDQDWVSHAEMWDRLHLLISNKLSFKLNQGLSDLAFIGRITRRLGYHSPTCHRLLIYEVLLGNVVLFSHWVLHLKF